MGSIVITQEEFSDSKGLCPSCGGQVNVNLNRTRFVSFTCPDCSFEQLFEAVYVHDYRDFPLPCELYQPTSPY